MRNLTITRRKLIAGALIPYFCIIGPEKSSADDSDGQYPINNGETITIPLAETASVMVVAADTSTGLVFSDPAAIPAGTEDLAADIVTRYSLSKGSSYLIRFR